jgi:hypothetical protein
VWSEYALKKEEAMATNRRLTLVRSPRPTSYMHLHVVSFQSRRRQLHGALPQHAQLAELPCFVAHVRTGSACTAMTFHAARLEKRWAGFHLMHGLRYCPTLACEGFGSDQEHHCDNKIAFLWCHASFGW